MTYPPRKNVGRASQSTSSVSKLGTFTSVSVSDGRLGVV